MNRRDRQEKFSIRKTNRGAVSTCIAVLSFLALANANQGVQAEEVIFTESDAELVYKNTESEMVGEDSPLAEEESAPLEEVVEDIAELETEEVTVEPELASEPAAEIIVETPAEEQAEEETEVAEKEEVKVEETGTPVAVSQPVAEQAAVRVATTTYRVRYVDEETNQVVYQRNQTVSQEVVTEEDDHQFTVNLPLELDTATALSGYTLSENQEVTIRDNAIEAIITERGNRQLLVNVRKDDVAASDGDKESYSLLRADEEESTTKTVDEWILKGLNQVQFASIQHEANDFSLVVKTEAGSPNIYYNNAYASLRVINANGTTAYSKDWIGSGNYTATTDTVALQAGDLIYLTHREASDSLLVISPATLDTESKSPEVYVVQEDGSMTPYLGETRENGVLVQTDNLGFPVLFLLGNGTAVSQINGSTAGMQSYPLTSEEFASITNWINDESGPVAAIRAGYGYEQGEEIEIDMSARFELSDFAKDAGYEIVSITPGNLPSGLYYDSETRLIKGVIKEELENGSSRLTVEVAVSNGENTFTWTSSNIGSIIWKDTKGPTIKTTDLTVGIGEEVVIDWVARDENGNPKAFAEATSDFYVVDGSWTLPLPAGTVSLNDYYDLTETDTTKIDKDSLNSTMSLTFRYSETGRNFSEGLPAGLTYDSETGQITGVPTTAGTYYIEVTATDFEAISHPQRDTTNWKGLVSPAKSTAVFTVTVTSQADDNEPTAQPVTVDLNTSPVTGSVIIRYVDLDGEQIREDYIDTAKAVIGERDAETGQIIEKEVFYDTTEGVSETEPKAGEKPQFIVTEDGRYFELLPSLFQPSIDGAVVEDAVLQKEETKGDGDETIRYTGATKGKVTQGQTIITYVYRERSGILEIQYVTEDGQKLYGKSATYQEIQGVEYIGINGGSYPNINTNEIIYTADDKVYRLATAGDYPVGQVGESGNLTEFAPTSGRATGEVKLVYVYSEVQPNGKIRYLSTSDEEVLPDEDKIFEIALHTNLLTNTSYYPSSYTKPTDDKITITKADGRQFQYTNKNEYVKSGEDVVDTDIVIYRYEEITPATEPTVEAEPKELESSDEEKKTGSIIVRYVDYDGEELKEPQTILEDAEVGQEYDLTSIRHERLVHPNGRQFRIDKVEGQEQGQVVAGETTITYYYTWATGRVSVSYTIIGQDGNVIKAAVEGTINILLDAEPGTPYDVRSYRKETLEDDGKTYYLVPEMTENPEQGVVKENEHTRVVYYFRERHEEDVDVSKDDYRETVYYKTLLGRRASLAEELIEIETKIAEIEEISKEERFYSVVLSDRLLSYRENLEIVRVQLKKYDSEIKDFEIQLEQTNSDILTRQAELDGLEQNNSQSTLLKDIDGIEKAIFDKETRIKEVDRLIVFKEQELEELSDETALDEKISKKAEELKLLNQGLSELRKQHSDKVKERDAYKNKQEAEIDRLKKELTTVGPKSITTEGKELGESKDIRGNSEASWKKNNQKHELVRFAGEKDEVEVVPIFLTKEQYDNYQYNPVQVEKYFLEYVKKIREINGITIPVTQLKEASDFARNRAEENAKRNMLTHMTDLSDQKKKTYENAGTLPFSMINKDLKSDQELAYQLVFEWFSDYTNVVDGYGHRENLLGNPISIDTRRINSSGEILGLEKVYQATLGDGLGLAKGEGTALYMEQRDTQGKVVYGEDGKPVLKEIPNTRTESGYLHYLQNGYDRTQKFSADNYPYTLVTYKVDNNNIHHVVIDGKETQTSFMKALKFVYYLKDTTITITNEEYLKIEKQLKNAERDLDEQMRSYNVAISELDKEIKTKEALQNSLEEEVSVLKATKQNIRQKRQNLMNDIQSLNDEKKKLNDSIALLKEELNTKREQIKGIDSIQRREELKRELNHLIAKKADVEQQLTDKVKNRVELLGQEIELKQDIQKIEEEIKEEDEFRQRIEDKLEELRQQRNDNRDKDEQNEDRIDDIERYTERRGVIEAEKLILEVAEEVIVIPTSESEIPITEQPSLPEPEQVEVAPTSPSQESEIPMAELPTQPEHIEEVPTSSSSESETPVVEQPTQSGLEQPIQPVPEQEEEMVTAIPEVAPQEDEKPEYIFNPDDFKDVLKPEVEEVAPTYPSQESDKPAVEQPSQPESEQIDILPTVPSQEPAKPAPSPSEKPEVVPTDGQKVTGSVIIRYVDYNDEELRAPETILADVEVGQAYDVTSNRQERLTHPNGRQFRIDKVEGQEQGQIVAGETTITYYYTWATGRVVVRYHIVDQEDNIITAIAGSPTINILLDAEPGTPYDVRSYRKESIVEGGKTYYLVPELTKVPEQGVVIEGELIEIGYYYRERLMSETPDVPETVPSQVNGGGFAAGAFAEQVVDAVGFPSISSQATSSAVDQSATTETTLPNTGEATSLVALLGASLLTTAGVGIKRRRR